MRTVCGFRSLQSTADFPVNAIKCIVLAVSTSAAVFMRDQRPGFTDWKTRERSNFGATQTTGALQLIICLYTTTRYLHGVKRLIFSHTI